MLECTLGTSYIDYHSGPVQVRVENAPNPVDPNRKVLICRRCKRKCRTIVYSGVWGCARCLRLHNRCQVVDEPTREWERWEELRKLLRRGRPRYMRQSTFMDAAAELRALQKKLKGRLMRVANEEHRRRITAEWFLADDARDKVASYPNYFVENGRAIVRPEGWWEAPVGSLLQTPGSGSLSQPQPRSCATTSRRTSTNRIPLSFDDLLRPELSAFPCAANASKP